MNQPNEPQQMLLRDKAWSDDEEYFNCDTLQELIDMNDFEPGRVVFVGDVVPVKVSRYCDADDVIEMMGERAYDDVGEAADNWPDVTKEARDELDALLVAWVEKHSKPTFYRITNVTEYTITAEDLA